MILILFGDGVVAQVILSNNTKGDYQSISWCWGIGVMFGVYCSGGISGGHLNPAVTLTNCIYRGFSWQKLPIYTVAQMLGAFCGSLILYGNYLNAINMFEGYGVRTVSGATATAGIFCTYPAEFMTRTGMFFSEVVASAILMIGIYAINDDDNMAAGDLAPVALFFLIFGIGAAFGWQTGYAINPARDFGPRMASFAVGYGSEVFSAGGYYFWIPIVAPCIGCAFGGFLYDSLVYTGAESPINMKYVGFARLRQFIHPHGEKSEEEEEVEYRHNPNSLTGQVHGYSAHDILGLKNVLPLEHRGTQSMPEVPQMPQPTPLQQQHPPPKMQVTPSAQHVEKVNDQNQ
jgi:aquaglyceroporin related protein